MIKTIGIPAEKLRQLLNLPRGVEVASVHTSDYRMMHIIVADPHAKLPENCYYNEKTRKWIKSPSNKGAIRGSSIKKRGKK